LNSPFFSVFHRREMPTLVTYSSLTGNTRRVAEAVFDALQGEKVLLPIAEAEAATGTADAYERIILGCWLDKGDANEEALKFAAKLKNKTLGLILTLGGNPESERAAEALARIVERLQQNGNTVKTAFKCQGAVEPQLIERIKLAWVGPVPAEKLKAWEEAKKHPDSTDFAAARAVFSTF
jgi:flavodoxin